MGKARREQALTARLWILDVLIACDDRASRSMVTPGALFGAFSEAGGDGATYCRAVGGLLQDGLIQALDLEDAATYRGARTLQRSDLAELGRKILAGVARLLAVEAPSMQMSNPGEPGPDGVPDATERVTVAYGITRRGREWRLLNGPNPSLPPPCPPTASELASSTPPHATAGPRLIVFFRPAPLSTLYAPFDLKERRDCTLPHGSFARAWIPACQVEALGKLPGVTILGVFTDEREATEGALRHLLGKEWPSPTLLELVLKSARLMGADEALVQEILRCLGPVLERRPVRDLVELWELDPTFPKETFDASGATRLEVIGRETFDLWLADATTYLPPEASP